MERDDALALTELKNHRGWKVFREFLVNEHNATVDKLVLSQSEDIKGLQERLKLIREIAELFDDADNVEREAREDRLNNKLNGLATS